MHVRDDLDEDPSRLTQTGGVTLSLSQAEQANDIDVQTP